MLSWRICRRSGGRCGRCGTSTGGVVPTQNVRSVLGRGGHSDRFPEVGGDGPGGGHRPGGPLRPDGGGGGPGAGMRLAHRQRFGVGLRGGAPRGRHRPDRGGERLGDGRDPVRPGRSVATAVVVHLHRRRRIRCAVGCGSGSGRNRTGRLARLPRRRVAVGHGGPRWTCRVRIGRCSIGCCPTPPRSPTRSIWSGWPTTSWTSAGAGSRTRPWAIGDTRQTPCIGSVVSSPRLTNASTTRAAPSSSGYWRQATPRVRSKTRGMPKK